MSDASADLTSEASAVSWAPGKASTNRLLELLVSPSPLRLLPLLLLPPLLLLLRPPPVNSRACGAPVEQFNVKDMSSEFDMLVQVRV